MPLPPHSSMCAAAGTGSHGQIWGDAKATNKPLLKTVFKVMMRLFSPRKTTMLSKIWDGVPKPHAHKDTPLSGFSNVQVVARNNYEEKEELFKERVSSLRDMFQHDKIQY